MGRKRLPTKILQIRGSKRLYDRPKNEPVPPAGMPEIPDWLKGEARKEWNRKAKQLIKQGTLTVVDDMAFAGYCILYEILKKSYEKCRNKSGIQLTEKKANGSKCKKTELSILKNTVNDIKLYMAEFGMTPSSRAGINLPEKPTELVDKAQQWIEQQKGAG